MSTRAIITRISDEEKQVLRSLRSHQDDIIVSHPDGRVSGRRTCFYFPLSVDEFDRDRLGYQA